MLRPALLALCGLATASTLVAQGTPTRGASPGASRPAPPTPVTIVFTDNAFDAPAEIPAGMVTFHAVNKGKELHHATLVRLEKGHSVDELAAALKNPGPPPPWITWYGGPQNASVVTIPIPEGDYAWVCLIPGADGIPHFVKGMIRGMKAVPSKTVTPAPKADITVSMADYNWTFSKPLTRGRHVLRIINVQGAQPHEFVLVRLPPGKTSQDVIAWAAHPTGMPPALSVEGIAAMQSGLTNYTAIDFKPGHYVALCFVPDAKDGKPHAEHGMVKDIIIQ